MKNFSSAANPILLLGVINRGESYAYEIIKELSQLADHSLPLHEGTVYPLLKKLKSKGYLRSKWKSTPGGHKRKYYTITQSGKILYYNLKDQWKSINQTIENLDR